MTTPDASLETVLHRLDDIERVLLNLAAMVRALVVEDEDVAAAGMSLDGPVPNALRDQTQPL